MASPRDKGASRARRAGSPLVALLVFLLTAAGAALTYPGFLVMPTAREKAARAGLLAKLPQTYRPLTLAVSDRDGDRLTVNLGFHDLSGRLVATLGRTFTGPSLALDLSPLRIPGAPASDVLLLPRLLRGRGGEADAALLYDLYDAGGLPALLMGDPRPEAGLSPAEAGVLKAAFAGLRGKNAGAVKGNLLLLSGLEAGTTYAVVLGPGQSASVETLPGP